MRALAPRTARAPVCGSASATAAAEDVGHWNADHQGTKWGVLLTFASFERYELDRASAVHHCCDHPLNRHRVRLLNRPV
jgi:hypothetical protein